MRREIVNCGTMSGRPVLSGLGGDGFLPGYTALLLPEQTLRPRSEARRRGMKPLRPCRVVGLRIMRVPPIVAPRIVGPHAEASR